MPGNHEGEFPLVEHVQVPCLYVTGLAIEADDHVVRLVGWVAMPDLGGETVERRIVARLAMPIITARRMRDALNARLKQGH